MNNKFLKRTIIPLGFLIMFCIETILIFNSVSVKEGKSDILYSYKATPTGNYNVVLKPNNYIDTKQLGMNQLYISKLVDKVVSRFNYQYSSSEKANLTYTYGINASIIGEYQTTNELNNNKVWSKNFVLLPSTSKTVNDTGFTLSENISIDYVYYNNIVENFYREINLPMRAYLSVIFKVNVRGEPESNVGTINEDSTYEMKIPLHEQAFQITTKTTNNPNQNISKITNATKNVNSLTLILSGIAFILTIVVFFKYCQKTFASNESAYRKQINRILKEYGDIIVEITNLMDTSNMSIVDVKTFNELLDLEAEIRTPILYYESLTEGWFMITQGNNLYRYIVVDEEQR